LCSISLLVDIILLFDYLRHEIDDFLCWLFLPFFLHWAGGVGVKTRGFCGNESAWDGSTGEQTRIETRDTN
jgi:hypothetical protein